MSCEVAIICPQICKEAVEIPSWMTKGSRGIIDSVMRVDSMRLEMLAPLLIELAQPPKKNSTTPSDEWCFPAGVGWVFSQQFIRHGRGGLFKFKGKGDPQNSCILNPPPNIIEQNCSCLRRLYPYPTVNPLFILKIYDSLRSFGKKK